MVKFAFVVATSPKLPRPALCEGGVYCDDAATRGDDDYSDNDIRRAHLDATRYNVDYAKFGGTYEVRDSLEGVDVSDPDVLESLVAWQLAAVSEAVRDHPAYQAGRAAWSSNVTKGDNPHHRADSENRTLWNLGWQDACDAGDKVSLAKPEPAAKPDKTPDDFPPAVGVVNVAKAATPAAIVPEWVQSAQGVAFNMVGRIVAKLARDASGTTKATDAYVVDGGKVEARGTMSLSGVTVRWVFVPTDGSGTRERQIITTHAVRLIAARMQGRLS